MVKSKKEEIKVKFCPKCKSTKIKYVFEFGNIFGVLPMQKCMECNLKSSVFPILVIDKEKLEKMKKKKTKGFSNSRSKNSRASHSPNRSVKTKKKIAKKTKKVGGKKR